MFGASFYIKIVNPQNLLKKHVDEKLKDVLGVSRSTKEHCWFYRGGFCLKYHNNLGYYLMNLKCIFLNLKINQSRSYD